MLNRIAWMCVIFALLFESGFKMTNGPNSCPLFKHSDVEVTACTFSERMFAFLPRFR